MAWKVLWRIIALCGQIFWVGDRHSNTERGSKCWEICSSYDGKCLEHFWDSTNNYLSDQGATFAGRWWKTMCSRLGIRQAYSQAHRAQANGRAEVAGKTVYNLLRKLHAEQRINWVEALPRVLRYHHNAIGETGLSPYQTLFGRDRPEAGLPYTPPMKCPSAQTFFYRIE